MQRTATATPPPRPEVIVVSAATETPYLRPDAAAAFCAIPVASLTTMRNRGGGPVFFKVGRRVVYRRADLIAWMETNKRKSTSDSGPTQ